MYVIFEKHLSFIRNVNMYKRTNRVMKDELFVTNVIMSITRARERERESE